jgi:hypothetical protein
MLVSFSITSSYGVLKTLRVNLRSLRVLVMVGIFTLNCLCHCFVELVDHVCVCVCVFLSRLVNVKKLDSRDMTVLRTVQTPTRHACQSVIVFRHVKTVGLFMRQQDERFLDFMPGIKLPVSDSHQGRIFPFATKSSPALGPTQPPSQ